MSWLFDSEIDDVGVISAAVNRCCCWKHWQLVCKQHATAVAKVTPAELMLSWQTIQVKHVFSYSDGYIHWDQDVCEK